MRKITGCFAIRSCSRPWWRDVVETRRLAPPANGEDGESVRERKMIATEPLGNPVRLKSDACEIVLEKIGFKELQLVSECESVGALEKMVPPLLI